ncbi:uncharacterized protein TNCV_1425061 [Trichonephila clavipes]|nr:uncharacterized protein TNCV_1425061 [Trichonephila clavipes]
MSWRYWMFVFHFINSPAYGEREKRDLVCTFTPGKSQLTFRSVGGITVSIAAFQAVDPDRALLVKLFYQNDNSAIVALRKFWTLKGMRKGPLTAINLRLMVTKFEETGSLNVRSGKGKKPVSAEAIEKVALRVEEDKASKVQASTSVHRVAEALDLPRSTVQIMRNILRY